MDKDTRRRETKAARAGERGTEMELGGGATVRACSFEEACSGFASCLLTSPDTPQFWHRLSSAT